MREQAITSRNQRYKTNRGEKIPQKHIFKKMTIDNFESLKYGIKIGAYCIIALMLIYYFFKLIGLEISLSISEELTTWIRNQ